MSNLYVAESFENFKAEKTQTREELKNLKKNDTLVDYYGEQWNVIAIGTYDEVKEYDESGSAQDMLESNLIKEKEILIAAKSKSDEVGVFVYGNEGLIKEENIESP